MDRRHFPTGTDAILRTTASTVQATGVRAVVAVQRVRLGLAESSTHVSTVVTHADLRHPMIACAPFTREGWIFELKHDGFRALARKDGTRAQLLSRTGRPMAEAFPEVVDGLSTLPGDIVLDAELIVPDTDGRSDFEELRRRALLQRPRLIEQAAAHCPAVLVVFDRLELDGEDLRPLPLLDRRDIVHWFGSPVPGIQPIEYIETRGEALFREIARHDQEGIVAKRIDAPYRAGRQPTWVKITNKDYSRRGAVEWQGR